MYADTSAQQTDRPITLSQLRQMKKVGEKFSCLTCYDASFTRAMNQAGVETILIGDSLGMVVQGQDSTLPVSIEEMCYHTTAVKRGNSRAFLIADMPFMSYSTPNQALESAAKLMRAGAHMVKLEGGRWLCDSVRLLSERGIPVCAHLGLTPQAVHKLGGYKVQGRDKAAADLMLKESQELVQAGADMLLYECIPSELGNTLTQAVPVPVIGIGAGAYTDGQVLVMHDMLGVNMGKPARFVKNFLSAGHSIEEAFAAYVEEVKKGTFPAMEHTFDT